MKFIQVVRAESDPTPSGAPLRNRSNYLALSMLSQDEGGSRSTALRSDKTREKRPFAPILAPLLTEDIERLVADCAQDRPTFVLIEGIQHQRAILALSEAVPDLPIVLDMHNIESTLLAQTDTLLLPRPLRVLAALMRRRRYDAALAAERSVIGRVRQIWVCSEDDRREAVKRFGPCPIAVVPNPIPHWTQDFQPGRRDPSEEILFVGHLGYPPNQRAVELLCREIMPAVLRSRPGARLHICGRRPRRRISALVAARGHRLTADAEDLGTAYADAAVAVMPLTAGGGTRLKVLEAMAVGCPIVATAKAVEGLGLEAHLHYRPAEGAADFVRAILETLAAPDEAKRMAERARHFAIHRYGPAARLAAVRTALAEAGLLAGHDADA